MIIKAIKQLIETQTTLLQKKANTFKVESVIDQELVDCKEVETNYTGYPPPAYLPEDPWFPDPILSEKQMSIKEAHDQAVADQQILDESQSKESADIHQKLYEVATKNWTTVGETQISAQGGSENFQEGPDGWQSGTGYSQFRG